jgi:putative transcriptional regulator
MSVLDTTVHHHPSDATLLSYAAGALAEGMALVVATHLAFCAVCRDGVGAAEAIGGGLLDETPPERLNDAARAEALRRIAAPAPPRPATAARERDPLIPGPLADYLGGNLAELPWRRLPGSIRQVELLPRDARGGNLRLFRVGPGHTLPRHGHHGSELTIVLCGSFIDEIGRFARGDVAELDADVVHQPVVDTDDDCICLIATDAPLKFGTLVGRIAQRLIGL